MKMALRLLAPKVGDLAYPPYCPQKAGKIVMIESGMATILMPNGTRYVEDARYLKDFRALADEHRQKADKFLALVRRLESLKEGA
jgi:hypothetical protein